MDNLDWGEHSPFQLAGSRTMYRRRLVHHIITSLVGTPQILVAREDKAVGEYQWRLVKSGAGGQGSKCTFLLI